jgi:hypothetical protein
MPGMYEQQQPMKREELGDEIFNVESHETPFLRLLPKGDTPNQMLAEWPVQAYPRRGFKGVVDGYDVDEYNKTTREKVQAYSQWLMESWMVSKLANVTNAAGVQRNERAKQATDALLLLNKKLERLYLSNQETAAEAGAAQAYETRGALRWLQTAAQATLPVPADFRPPAGCVHTGALSTLTPTVLETMLETASRAKLAPVDLTGFVGIKLKSRMSTWGQKVLADQSAAASTTIVTQQYNLNAADKRLIHVIDEFIFDAGRVKTIPTYYLACDPETGEDTDYTSRSGIFVDIGMWEKRFLQMVESVVEPPKSGGPRGYHDVITLLACKNPLGQCMVYSDTD